MRNRVVSRFGTISGTQSRAAGPKSTLQTAAAAQTALRFRIYPRRSCSVEVRRQKSLGTVALKPRAVGLSRYFLIRFAGFHFLILCDCVCDAAVTEQTLVISVDNQQAARIVVVPSARGPGVTSCAAAEPDRPCPLADCGVFS